MKFLLRSLSNYSHETVCTFTGILTSFQSDSNVIFVTKWKVAASVKALFTAILNDVTDLEESSAILLDKVDLVKVK